MLGTLLQLKALDICCLEFPGVPSHFSMQVDKEQNALSESPARNTLWTHLNGDVDPALCTAPLSAYCFMTGFM